MARKALGVVAGLAVWIAVVTVAGVIIRAAWPAYASVADAMTFTLSMMIARLSIGAVATVVAGWVAAAIARRSTLATLLTGILLLAGFIPQHIMLWEKFPIWYHLTFLVSLIPLAILGGKLEAMRTAEAENIITARPMASR
jgi:hypothetical protein